MNELRLKTHIFSEEIFQFSLITYLVLLLSESLKTGFVSNFINLNIPLFIVLITGVLMVLTQQDKFEVIKPEKRNLSADIQTSIVLAVIGGLLVFFKTQELGKISIAISILTMVLITFLSILLLTDSATVKPEIEDITEDSTTHRENISKSIVLITPLPAEHVIRSQMKALLALEKAHAISEKLKKKFENTENHSHYLEKLHPLNAMILESLQTLTEDLEEDSLYHKLVYDTPEDKTNSKRERLEKMVILYVQNLRVRLSQM